MIHTEDTKNLEEYLDIMNEKDMEKRAKRLRESIDSKVRKGGEKEIKAVHDMAKMIAREAMNNCDRTMKEIEEDKHAEMTGVVVAEASGLIVFLCSVSAAIQTYLDVEEIVFEEMVNRAYTKTAHECKCKAEDKQKEGEGEKTITLTMEELKSMEKDDWKPTQKVKEFLSECQENKPNKCFGLYDKYDSICFCCEYSESCRDETESKHE